MLYLQQLGIVRWVTKQHHPVAVSTDLVIVTEASSTPNDTADQLLTAMLKAINLTRDDVRITDASQIHTLQPSLILAMGENVAQALLNTNASLESLRGKLHQYGEAQTPLIVTYHPAYLLQNPVDKKNAYADLLLLKQSRGSVSII